MSVAKNLAKNLGGKWSYDGVSSWWCDDGVRHVSRCCSDYSDEYGPIEYWLYGVAPYPQRAEQYLYTKNSGDTLSGLIFRSN